MNAVGIEVCVARQQGRFTLQAEFDTPFAGVTGLVCPSGAGGCMPFSSVTGQTLAAPASAASRFVTPAPA